MENHLPHLLQIFRMVCHAFWTYQCPRHFPVPHEQCLLGPPGYMRPRLFIDILIYSDTLEEHRCHIHEVLLQLWNNKLYAHGDKCSFHEDTVEYLGSILSPNGLSMDPGKVSAILEWPEPHKVKDIQSFLGFANFYRRLISDYSKITLPLTCLTCKGTPWDFSDACRNSFESLKKAFTTAPVLA